MTKKEEYKSFMNFMLILDDFFHRTVDLFMQYSPYLNKILPYAKHCARLQSTKRKGHSCLLRGALTINRRENHVKIITRLYKSDTVNSRFSSRFTECIKQGMITSVSVMVLENSLQRGT